MDTGCPGLLMLPQRPLLPRKRACLAQTPESASYPGNGVERAAALTNVVGATDLLEIVRSQGETAVAEGLPLETLHLPRRTDTIEVLHPGGEIKNHKDDPHDLFTSVLFFLLLRQKDI